MAKILLIDDDQLMLRMYQTKFKVEGLEVEVASDGDEGLAKVGQSKPDLILLDIMMPKINGLEVLRQLKAKPETKDIPVILLTNLGGSQQDVDQGLSLGAVSYLVKASYTPAQVVAKVKEILAGYVRGLPKVQTSVKAVSQEEEAAQNEVAKAKKKIEEAKAKLEEAEQKAQKVAA